MHYLYLSYQPSVAALEKERAALEGWCEEQRIADYRILEEKLTGGRISERMIDRLLDKLVPGDTLVATSLIRLGRSLNMLLGVLQGTLSRGTIIYLIEEQQTLAPGPETEKFINTLELAANIITGIKTQRNSESRAASQAPGRPQGAKKKETKLAIYGKTEQILAMRTNGATLDEIARTIGVSRGTVANYLKEKHQ